MAELKFPVFMIFRTEQIPKIPKFYFGNFFSIRSSPEISVRFGRTESARSCTVKQHRVFARFLAAGGPPRKGGKHEPASKCHDHCCKFTLLVIIGSFSLL